MEKLLITTLSPVHTGTGIELGAWDFIAPARDNKVYFVDFDKINIEPEILTKTIEEESGLEAILKKKNMNPKEVSKYILHRDGSASIGKGIREQQKNINNLPYIPGTEIKGAIRTAIMT